MGESSEKPSTTPRDRGHVSMALWVGLVAVLLWLAVTSPWLLGKRTLIQRDVFITHLHYKAYGAAQLAEGRIPAINTAWGLGQPFRGNPNALPYYPGNLAYLVLPFWSAFGAHYALHWLLAGLAMTLLARRLGRSPPAAALAGITYAGGVVISALSFYNTLTVLAWWPLVLVGAAGRRGAADSDRALRAALSDPAGLIVGALAFGMAILGGEPVALAILIPTALLPVWRRHNLGSACLRLAAIVGLGALLAAPQIIATLRILPFTARGGPGVESNPSLGFALQAPRLLEYLVPFPFGIPFRFDAWGYWATENAHQIPYYYELFGGALLLPLVLYGWRRQSRWMATAGLGIFVAWLGGQVSWLSTLSFGMFRHPEKFLLWPALCLPLLAAVGFDRLRTQPSGKARGFLLMSLAPALALAGIALGFNNFVTWQTTRLDGAPPPGTGDAQALLWIGGLAWLMLGLLAAAWFLGCGKPNWLLPVQLVSLLPLLALLPTDSTQAYGPSAFQRALGDRRAIWSPLHSNLSARTHPAPRYSTGDLMTSSRFMTRDLEPAAGVLNGLRYPIAADLEGLSSPLLNPLVQRIAGMPTDQQLHWLRALGVEAVVVSATRRMPLPELADQPSPDGEVLLQAVVDPMPDLLWPPGFEKARLVSDAYRRVTLSPDPVERPVLLQPERQGALRRLERLAWEPDRLAFEVDSDGGVVVLRRAFHPLYRAHATGGDGRRVELPRLLANAFLLAVRVPPGRQRVVIDISSAPEWAGVAACFVTLVFLVGWLLRLPSRRRRHGEVASDRPGRPAGVTSPR